jgi:hypothetical protein
MNVSKLHESIGEVVVYFNMLDQTLAEEICRELGLEGDELRDSVCASMSFAQKRDFLAAIVHQDREIEPKVKTNKLKLLGQLEGIDTDRNKIMHSTYATVEREVITRRKPKTKGGKGLKVQFEDVEIESIEKLSTRIQVWVIGWMFAGT